MPFPSRNETIICVYISTFVRSNISVFCRNTMWSNNISLNIRIFVHSRNWPFLKHRVPFSVKYFIVIKEKLEQQLILVERTAEQVLMYPVNHSYKHKWSRKLAASLLLLVVIYKCCEIYVTAYDWHLKDYMVFYTFSLAQNGFLPILMIVKKGLLDKMPIALFTTFCLKEFLQHFAIYSKRLLPAKDVSFILFTGSQLKKKKLVFVQSTLYKITFNFYCVIIILLLKSYFFESIVIC